MIGSWFGRAGLMRFERTLLADKIGNDFVHVFLGGGGCIKPPPTSILGEVDIGTGIPQKEIEILWTRPKSYANPA
jgi:hypothetical protein